VQSVVVNQRSGFVIDGHLRVTLAIRSGQAMVPVTYVDLSELLGWLDWCERADGVLLGRSQRLAHRHATGCPLEDAQWRAAEQRLHVAYRSQDLETWRAELTAYESFALNYFAAYEKEHGHAQ
jgi:hypothetical protein